MKMFHLWQDGFEQVPDEDGGVPPPENVYDPDAAVEYQEGEYQYEDEEQDEYWPRLLSMHL